MRATFDSHLAHRHGVTKVALNLATQAHNNSQLFKQTHVPRRPCYASNYDQSLQSLINDL